MSVRAFGPLLLLLGAGCTGCTRGSEQSRASTPPDTAVAAPSTKPPATSYLGLRYDSMPPHITYRAGSVTPGNFDFALVNTPRALMIWLDSITDSRGAGGPAKIVRAELAIPPLASDERVFMSSCDVNGTLDPMVVAIIVDEPNVTRYTKVRQAWRANARASRFDVIPVDGLSCEQP